MRQSVQLEKLIINSILTEFVRDVADNRTKIDILHYFHGQANDPICRGPFVTTQKLADRVQHNLWAVKHAIVELNKHGAVSYFASFGDIDLCYMDTKLHTPQLTQGLEALVEAIDSHPQDVDECLKAAAAERGT